MLASTSFSTCRSTLLQQLRQIATRTPVEMSYTAHGDPTTDRARPPLVICHGLFGQKTNWNSVGKALQRRLGNVVYMVDMRNHGESPWVDSMTYADMASDVAEFMRQGAEETGFKKLSLLGHSMGGKAAMRMAVDPDGGPLVDRLIIEDVSPRGYSPNNMRFRDYIHSMRKLDMNKSRRELSDAMAEVVPDLTIRQFLLTNLQSTENGSFKWKCNIDVIDRYVDDVLGFSIPSGAFRGPTLFLYGGTSPYVPNEDKPTIRCLFPRVIFEAVPKAGHWVHAEQPKAFVDAVCRFLD